MSNKKVCISVMGGLGNRLFQIATLYAYCKKHKILSYGFKTHISTLHSSIDYSKEVYPFIQHLPLTNYILFQEPYYLIFVYNPIPVVDNDLFLQGYFQNEKYFKEVRSELIDLFQFKPLSFEPKSNSVFIHVRRGDFLKCPEHNIDLEEYYIQSIVWFKQKIKDLHLYVISDDIEYCINNNSFSNLIKSITYVKELNELETMTLMKSCDKGGICSNSSFSWWGSYLNDSPSKNIMFPSKWLNNDYPNDIYFSKSYVMDLNTFDVKQIS